MYSTYHSLKDYNTNETFYWDSCSIDSPTRELDWLDSNIVIDGISFEYFLAIICSTVHIVII